MPHGETSIVGDPLSCAMSHRGRPPDSDDGRSSHNFDHISVETERLDWCLAALNETLNSLENVDDKSAYLHAARYGKNVLEIEANPRLFILAEQYNVRAAAQRMISYWYHRRSIFGQNKFTRFISLANDEAMESDDLTTLQDGFLAALPDNNHGQCVLCIDESRRNEECSLESRLRSTFYLLSVLSAREDQHSISSICILLVFRRAKFDFGDVRRLVKLLTCAMPIKVNAVHLACVVPKESRIRFEQQTVPFLRKKFGDIFHERTHVHSCFSPSDMVERLRPFGFSPEGLPESVGGHWDYNDVGLWLKWRTEVDEYKAEAKLSPQSREILLKSKHSEDSTSSQEKDTNRTSPGNVVVKSGDNQNSFSSDIEAQELDEESRQLSTSKRKFGDETQHELKQDHANSKVIELRRRNAIYSKRKYDKKKLEVERLIQTRCDLEAENRQLIEENTTLTSLLALAQAKASIEESAILQVLKKSRTSSMKNHQSYADIMGAPSSLLRQLTFPHGHSDLNLPMQGGVPVLSSSAQLDQLVKSNMLGDPLTSIMGRQERQKTNPLNLQQYLQSYEHRGVNQSLPPNNMQQNELTRIPAVTYANIGHVQRSVAESPGLRLWDHPFLSATQNISGMGANIAVDATQLQSLLSRSNGALHPTNTLDLLTASSAQSDTLNTTQSVLENLVARGQPLQQRLGQKQQQQLSDTDALIEYLRRRKRQHDDTP